jgi:hypothetical protein
MRTKRIAGTQEPRTVLRPEQLEAWRLSQQHLLEQAPRRALTRVVSDNVAIHAQLASAAELQLRARVEGIQATSVRDAVAARRLVKTWAMRGTLHLVTARDLPLLVAASSARLRYDRASWLRYFGVTKREMELLFLELPKVLNGNGVTREALADEMGRRVAPRFAEHLRSGWGTLLKQAAFQGLLCFGRSEGQRVTFVRPDRWLRGWTPSTLSPEEALAEMARRYLHRYGPAPHTEFARWWGTDPSHARRIFHSIEDELAPVEVDGYPMWVLASDLEQIAGIEPVSAGEPHVRLLPNFDPYVLFYAPRERLVPAQQRDRVFRKSAWISPVVLVNGLVTGIWEPKRKRDRMELTVEPFDRFTPAVRRALAEEVDAIGTFSGLPATATFGRVRDGGSAPSPPPV